MVLLYGEFFLLIQLWGKRVYREPLPLKRYGLEATKQNSLELIRGLCIGAIALSCLLAVEGALGWIKWQFLDGGFQFQIILEGCLLALAVGFAEELLFRGWLLDELQRDYSPSPSLWINAFLYALLHFIKPLEEIIQTGAQFIGLLLLGLIFVGAKRCSQGRLGLAIGLHAGLVWAYYITDVGQLIQSSQRVPSWVTGINGNPLAGVMGLLFLGAIALFFFRANLCPNKMSS